MYIDYYLGITILVLILLNAYISRLIQMLVKWYNRASKKEYIKLMGQKLNLQHEQSRLSMINNFAKYAKIQRRINTINEELYEIKSNVNTVVFVTAVLCQYGIKIPINTILFLMMIFYRHSPVLVLNDQSDPIPFVSLISYPLKEVNSVSVHIWALCCYGITKLIKA